MPTGPQAAAAYLRELLLRPGRYRRKWEQYAERSRLGQVNQLAVAEVLAHYLWEHPRAQGDVDVLPRQLKDTASRALSGKLLSKATLTLFTEAFGFGAFERERLLKLWEGSAHVRVLSGPRAIREDKASVLGRPQVKTLSLHDHHYLGPDGLPQRHRIIHVIEAVVDRVDRVPYRADTNALTIEVGQGFSGLAGPVYQPAGRTIRRGHAAGRAAGGRGNGDLGIHGQLSLPGTPPARVPPRCAVLRGEPGYSRRVSSRQAAGQRGVGGVGRNGRVPSSSGRASPWTANSPSIATCGSPRRPPSASTGTGSAERQRRAPAERKGGPAWHHRSVRRGRKRGDH